MLSFESVPNPHKISSEKTKVFDAIITNYLDINNNSINMLLIIIKYKSHMLSTDIIKTYMSLKINFLPL